MDGPTDYHTKWNKSDRERKLPCESAYFTWNLKKYIQTFTKQIYRFREQIYGYQGGRVKKRGRLGVWDWHVHTALFKIDNQRGLSV